MLGPLMTVPNTNPPKQCQVTAEIILPDKHRFKITPVRHCNELKPYIAAEFNSTTDYRVPPPTDDGEHAVEKVLSHDSKTKQSKMGWHSCCHMGAC